MSQVGLLFDNDGVLVDSSELHWLSWEKLMEEDPSFQMTKEQFVAGFGKRNEHILRDVAAEDGEKHVAWAKRKEEHFRDCAHGSITLLPGIEQFLQQVKAKQMPRIIASSTPVANLEMYLETTALGDYFDAYVSGEQVAEGKPAPDIFLAAAKRLGIPPERCIVFEDAPAGIQAGKSAGCFVVALATSYPAQELENYDLLFQTPHELDLEAVLQHFHENRG